MMLKMMNPMSSMPVSLIDSLLNILIVMVDCAWSGGGQGGAKPDQGGATGYNNLHLNLNCQQIQQNDNLQEQERLRKEALLVAERERHKKYRSHSSV